MSLAIFFILLFLILASAYFLFFLKQARTVVPIINEINSTLTAITTTTKLSRTYSESPLLFPRMRWAKMPLSVYVEVTSCSAEEAQEVTTAEKIWKEKTNGIIYFIDSTSNNSDVIVSCLKDSSSIREGRRIIRKVGEGGPSSVYDTGLFNLSTKGKIFLFTSTVGCDRPIIAMHEIGHVLGLDHSENPDSVMYEYEECNQDITPEIVSALKSLYSFSAKPDLYFSDASASQKNYYLFLNMTIKNQGLLSSEKTTISINVNGKELKSFPLDSLKPGQGYFFTLSNLFVSNEVTDLKISIDSGNNVDELYKSNNMISLVPK